MSDESQNETTAGEQPIRDDKGRFLPGVSGNPFGVNAGRPKGSGMMAEIERQLALEAADGRTHQTRIVETMIRMATEGDTRAMELILRRVAPEKLLLESDGIPLLLVRSFTGLQEEPRRISATTEIEAPALDVGGDDLPPDAESLANGRAHFRI